MDVIVIEQTILHRKRMKYNPSNNTFFETKDDSLGFYRGVEFPYGWLKDSGTPPNEHLDVILISKEFYKLGEEMPIRVIGVFFRNDCDHKLIAVTLDRDEVDFSQLTESEKAELSRLYPRVDVGEGWFGIEKANNVIHDFIVNGRKREH